MTCLVLIQPSAVLNAKNHESEAEIIIAAKDKALHRKYKGVSSNVVKEAFNWNEDYMIDEVVYPQAAGSASGVDR